MSVLITVKIQGDVDTFRQAMADRAEEFRAVAERGRQAGAVHHRFGVGPGFVLVVDEWGSAEQFEKFFGDPDMQAFVGSVGADTGVAPQITVCAALDSPDQF